MRKSKILFVLDHLTWFFIALLPLIVYIIGNFNGNITLSNILNDLGITTENNLLYRALLQFFNDDYEIQVFASNSILVQYVVYMVFTEILHLLVDTVLFLPKFMNKVLTKILGD